MTPSPPGAGTFPAAARPRGGSVRRTAGKGPWRAVPPRPLAGSLPSSLPFDHFGGDAFAVGDETRICALVIGAHSLRSGVGRAPRGRTGPGSATGISDGGQRRGSLAWQLHDGPRSRPPEPPGRTTGIAAPARQESPTMTARRTRLILPSAPAASAPASGSIPGPAAAASCAVPPSPPARSPRPRRSAPRRRPRPAASGSAPRAAISRTRSRHSSTPNSPPPPASGSSASPSPTPPTGW